MTASGVFVMVPEHVRHYTFALPVKHFKLDSENLVKCCTRTEKYSE